MGIRSAQPLPEKVPHSAAGAILGGRGPGIGLPTSPKKGGKNIERPKGIATFTFDKKELGIFLCIMKKILEVFQYGDHDIRFNTDINPFKHPEVIPELISNSAFAMTTSLWGGNEQAVLAVIRSLTIADLAVSVNREEMLRQLGEEAEALARCMQQAKEDFEKAGGKVMVFRPEIKPGKIRS